MDGCVFLFVFCPIANYKCTRKIQAFQQLSPSATWQSNGARWMTRLAVTPRCTNNPTTSIIYDFFSFFGEGVVGF